MRSLLVLLTMCESACAADSVASSGMTALELQYNFVEDEGPQQCGAVESFTGIATDVCQTHVKYTSGTEVGCLDAWVMWLTMSEAADENGVYHGQLKVMSDICDSTYAVTAAIAK